MGLSGPKNRTKLQQDPNNTKWTRDETTFGQKILRAQGWEPGQYLGVQNSSHSDHHTAASSAPIKILLKDDTLGLGAKVRQKQNDECTGLDVFKDLLGRLNGKSEDIIQKERQVRSDLKTSLYVEQRYGPMRFVKGGLLVGDKMNSLVSKTDDFKSPHAKEHPSVAGDDATTSHKKEKKSKKRRADEADSLDTPDENRDKKHKKRSKVESSSENAVNESSTDEKFKKMAKKSKKLEVEHEDVPASAKSKEKKRKKLRRDASEEDADPDTIAQEMKAVKKKAKMDKKEKKDKKRKRLDGSGTQTEIDATTRLPVVATAQASGVSTPVTTGTSTPQAVSNRNFARSRNIASKRLAIADMASLNQIFMVKPV